MRHPPRTHAPAGRQPARPPRARRAGGLPGLALILILGLGLSLAACGGDDGAGVRNVDGGSGSGGSGSGSGSGSSPGTTTTTTVSGLGGQGLSGTTNAAAGLEEYILPVGGGFYFALPGVDRPDALGDAHLVGHSYGGVVVGLAGERE